MFKILLIEDDLVDQMAFSRFLKRKDLDCSLEITDNLQEARLFLQDRTYDLIISDLNLPDGSALDLSDYFQQHSFLLISGLVTPEIKQRALAAGAKDIIAKSNDLQQFEQLLSYLKIESPSTPESVSTPAHLTQLLQTFDYNYGYVRDLITLFLQENKKMMSDLQTALNQQDWLQIRKLAHKLKTGFMLMGKKEAQETALQIEQTSEEVITSYEPGIKKLEMLTSVIYEQLEKDLIYLTQKQSSPDAN